MRKNLLLPFFILFAFIANAQWTKVNVPHDDGSFPYDVEMPNESSVWASIALYLGGSQTIYTNEYLRTADYGSSWTKTSIQAPSGYVISSLSPIDADTCYAAMFDFNVALGGGVFKTTDAGTTWAQLGAGTLFNSNSFPDFVYFWNAREGMALGDGNGPGTG